MMFRSFTALIVAVAALAAAFVFIAPSQVRAQGDTYVDLSVEVDATGSSSWWFTARNHGTATAYGVVLDVEFADQAYYTTLAGDRVFSSEFQQKSGSTCSGHIPGATCLSGVFPVGVLEPGEEKSFYIRTKLAPGLPCCPNSGDDWVVPARAEVKGTFPEEEERFRGDNTVTEWIYADSNSAFSDSRAYRAVYEMEATVDDLLPEPGDTVKFKFYVTRGVQQPIFDAKLRLKLDDGMGTPTATPPTGSTFATAPGLTRTWDWDFDIEVVGSTDAVRGKSLEVSTTLDDPLPAGVAVSDLCLTAELTARPDNISVHVRPVYTSAESCFREDPVVLFEEGGVILFSLHPCVGVTAYPCSNADNVGMWVVGEVRDDYSGPTATRMAGIARDKAVLDPARVFVQVKDPQGRRIDTYSASVNSGTAPSWHTARVAHANIGNSPVEGVQIAYTRREFTAEQRANYNRLDRTVAVAGLDGAAAPGLVKLRYPTSGNAEFTPNPSHTRTKSVRGLLSWWGSSGFSSR